MAKKSFLKSTDTAIADSANEAPKIFGGITDASAPGDKDPISDLLDRTNSYTIAATPIATTPVVPPSSPVMETDDEEEVAGVSPQFIQQQNEQLQGKKPGGDAAFGAIAMDGNNAEYAEAISDDDDRSGFASGDRAERRRRVISKFSGKFIDNFVSTASVMAHEVFVAPKAAIQEHSDLMARLSTLSPAESARLQQLDAQVKQYTELKSDYAVRAKMDKDDMDELQECISDVLNTEDVQIHPGWLILIIVGFQIIGNSIGIFFDRLAMRGR